MRLQATTWQTVGPFFHLSFESLYQHDIAGEGAGGERVAIEGRILDGDGLPIPDAVIEVWQANVQGKYAHPADSQDKPMEPGFRGFGRVPTDVAGRFHFTTIKPGNVPGPNGAEQAPHLVIGILMRGLLRGLVTRAYFPNEATVSTDPILQLVEPERRNTLMLQPCAERPKVFTWEIRMQGEGETVFLDF